MVDLTPAFAFAIASLVGILIGEYTRDAWDNGKLRRRLAVVRIRLRQTLRRIRKHL